MNSKQDKINVLGGYVGLDGYVHPSRNPLCSPKYDPRLDGQEIPEEVYAAASLLVNYFKTKGYTN